MCEHGQVEVLKLPERLQEDGRKTVCIDKCIAPVIQKLWDDGVDTLNCCCGHGRIVGGAELIIPSNADPTNLYNACEALKKHDPDRYWTILEWKLVQTAAVWPDRED